MLYTILCLIRPRYNSTRLYFSLCITQLCIHWSRIQFFNLTMSHLYFQIIHHDIFSFSSYLNSVLYIIMINLNLLVSMKAFSVPNCHQWMSCFSLSTDLKENKLKIFFLQRNTFQNLYCDICSPLCSLSSGDAIWHHGTLSTLNQIMACCLMAPSHYLNQF